jgi:steroid delta-isomerase
MSMRDQFDQLVEAYASATEAGDAEAISSLYTEDAILLTPDNPPISGRQAIQENYKRELGDGYKLIIKALDFKDLGDTAYAVSGWETEDETGNALDLLQRQSDGSLLLHRECWNVS